jgi:hypothetical protein
VAEHDGYAFNQKDKWWNTQYYSPRYLGKAKGFELSNVHYKNDVIVGLTELDRETKIFSL